MSPTAGRGTVFSARARSLVIVVACISFVGTVVSLLFGEPLAVPQSSGTDTYSRGAVGHQAFARTLRALGLHVVRLRHAGYGEATAPMVFLEPETEAQVAHRRVELGAALRERADKGLTSIVVLPKWRPSRDGSVTPVARADVQDLLEHIAEMGALDDSTLRDLVVRHRQPVGTVHRATFGGPTDSYDVQAPWLQYFHDVDPTAFDVLVGREGAALVIARPDYGRGRLVLVSDPDLAHSFNLQRSDHATLWADLLQQTLATDTVVIDETLHGHGHSPTLGAALGTFPPVLLALHAALLVLLLAAAGLRRFGPPVPLPPPHARGPTEVIGVTAAVFSAARPAGDIAVAYVTRVLADTAHVLGLASRSDATTADQNRQLDERATARGLPGQAAMLLRQTRRLSERTRQRDQDALRVARRAWDFQQSLIHRRPTRSTSATASINRPDPVPDRSPTQHSDP